jgi:[protein-PII] uridylyltransferase
VLDDLPMSDLASGARDAVAVDAFAGYLNKASMFNSFPAEEHLKALFLMTLATLDAEGALSEERARQFARLYDDTYSQLTKAYGDQMVDETLARRSAAAIARPAGMTEHELVEYLTAFPRRYLTLFDDRAISEHIRMSRQLGTAGDVQCALTKSGGGVWEATVVARDRPFLFASICGVLAHLNADIISGQALTSAGGIALGVFRFHDDEGALERSDPKPILIDAIAGRIDVEALVTHTPHAAPPASPDERMVSIDNDASARYSVIEMIAANAPGLLYRVSRALSESGCAIEMVVIATEGPRAHDVFHVTKGGQKLAPGDQRAVAAALEQVTNRFTRSGS